MPSPAHAGINRRANPNRKTAAAVPRARGDQPRLPRRAPDPICLGSKQKREISLKQHSNDNKAGSTSFPRPREDGMAETTFLIGRALERGARESGDLTQMREAKRAQKAGREMYLRRQARKPKD